MIAHVEISLILLYNKLVWKVVIFLIGSHVLEIERQANEFLFNSISRVIRGCVPSQVTKRHGDSFETQNFAFYTSATLSSTCALTLFLLHFGKVYKASWGRKRIITNNLSYTFDGLNYLHIHWCSSYSLLWQSRYPLQKNLVLWTRRICVQV